MFGVFDLENDSEENYYINICPECGADFDWNGLSKELMEAQEHVIVVRSRTESVYSLSFNENGMFNTSTLMHSPVVSDIFISK